MEDRSKEKVNTKAMAGAENKEKLVSLKKKQERMLWKNKLPDKQDTGHRPDVSWHVLCQTQDNEAE